jgi:Tol biopolymer transport system component
VAGGVYQVFSRSLSQPTAVQLTKGESDCSAPFWSPGGDRIYYLCDRSLWRVGAAGGAPEKAVDNVAAACLSPDGRTLLYCRSREGKLVYWTESPPGAKPGEWNGPSLSTSRVYLRFSPDGTRVAFASRHMHDDIVELPLDGSAVRGLLATSRNEHCASWSPSRRQFLFSKERAGSEEIWLRNVEEGWERPVVTAALFPPGTTRRVSEPEFSPDGLRAVFLRAAEGGNGAYVAAIAGGPPVFATGGTYPTWSPDGNWIAWRSLKGDLVLVRPDDSATVVLGNLPRVSTAGFSRDGSTLYGLEFTSDRRLSLRVFDVRTRKERPAIQFGSFPSVSVPHGLSLAPDGKSFATSILRDTGDIWILEGFGARPRS